MKPTPFVVIAFLVAAANQSGCATPKAGDRCAMGAAYCQGPGACLSCRAGTLVAFECNGPNGCQRDAERNILCDQSEGANAETPCLPAYEGKGQCGPNGILQCVGGLWIQIACPSEQQCKSDGSGVRCE